MQFWINWARFLACYRCNLVFIFSYFFTHWKFHMFFKKQRWVLLFHLVQTDNLSYTSLFLFLILMIIWGNKVIHCPNIFRLLKLIFLNPCWKNKEDSYMEPNSCSYRSKNELNFPFFYLFRKFLQLLNRWRRK